jgi:tetratricopeptide (TPR) repeat protein
MTLTATDPILGINGRYEELLIVREKKLAYARERGDHQIAGIYLSEVGETLGHLGDYPTAEARYREALTYLEKGTDYQYALRLCGLGEVLLVQGKAEEAYAIFKQSVLGMRIGEPWGLGKTLAGLSVATSMRGDPETAWITILQALEKHLEMHTFYFAHYSLAAYAFLLSQRGDVLSGIEIYTLLARQKFVHNSCWFDDLYCKEVYACGNVLHAEDISAAEARGKDLDLWETVDRLIREGLEPST